MDFKELSEMILNIAEKSGWKCILPTENNISFTKNASFTFTSKNCEYGVFDLYKEVIAPYSEEIKGIANIILDYDADISQYILRVWEIKSIITKEKTMEEIENREIE